MTSRRRRAMLIAAYSSVLAIAHAGCHPPAGDPGPGDAPTSTVQTWMSGEVFASAPEVQQWVLAFYAPSQGEVCMAFGLMEVDPAGGVSYENLPVYTAQVSAVSTTNGSELVGGYYYYETEAHSFVTSGDYSYRLEPREVEVRDAVTGLTVVLGEIAAELTNDDLVALLQPCHGFEADASPAPRGEE